MEELFEKLKSHIVTKLWDIARELDDDGRFVNSQEVDDLKDCLICLHKVHELSSSSPIKKVI